MSISPHASIRHARAGRIGESGQLPAGWRSENLANIEVLDLGSRQGPWITLRIGFDAKLPGEYAGLSLSPYLATVKGARIGLATRIEIGGGDNIGQTMLIVRELRAGGGLIGQTIRPVEMHPTPRDMTVSHVTVGEAAVTEPVLMLKRGAEGAGELELTLTGLAFGDVEHYPDWWVTVSGD